MEKKETIIKHLYSLVKGITDVRIYYSHHRDPNIGEIRCHDSHRLFQFEIREDEIFISKNFIRVASIVNPADYSSILSAAYLAGADTNMKRKGGTQVNFANMDMVGHTGIKKDMETLRLF